MSESRHHEPPLLRQLELRHFRMIAAIAATGSVSKAAERLFLSQPAASHALRSIEGRLAEPLFHRTPTGMVPTPLGERFVAAASEVLAAVQRLAGALPGGGPLVVRIATQCYTRYSWLPETLLGAESRPSVEIVAGASARPLDALSGSELDLAVVYESPAASRLPCVPIGTDEFVALVPRSHPLGSRPFLRPDDLRDQNLFVHTLATPSLLVTEFLNSSAVPPRSVRALQYTETVLAAVARGLGVAAVSRWVVEPEQVADRVAMLPLGREGMHLGWWLVGREGSWRTPHVRAVARLILDDLRARMLGSNPATLETEHDRGMSLPKEYP